MENYYEILELSNYPKGIGGHFFYEKGRTIQKEAICFKKGEFHILGSTFTRYRF